VVGGIDAGSEESLLETTMYRPSGPGPFPLVTINHGKPRPDGTDPSAMRPSFGAAAHWFVDRGFAVAVPMRRGYGLSSSPISDTAGPCSDRDYFATALKPLPRWKVPSPICGSRRSSTAIESLSSDSPMAG
jgi:hypothetical protein